MVQSGHSSSDQETWIFSLPLPANHDYRSVELVSACNGPVPIDALAPSRKGKRKSSTQQTASLAFEGAKASEVKSLLDNSDHDEIEMTFLDGSGGSTDEEDFSQSASLSPNHSWKFYSPLHGLVLESSTLLRLSYRPSWQNIPEYTKAKRNRTILKSITSCCTDSKQEQIWEVYSTKDIEKTEKLEMAIRGLGTCQAIKIYLNPLGERDADVFKAPRKYKTPLKVHQLRASTEQDQPSTNFSEPDDTLTNEEHHDYIVLTFAVPLDANLCGNNHDPPLLWKVDIPPHRSGESMALDTITVMDGSVDLREPANSVYIEGYQSWSFTGSVWKGKSQPTPAMPNSFSKAFDLGGSLPDPPTTMFPVSCDWETNLGNPDFLDSCKSSSRSSLLRKKNTKHKYKSNFFTCITTARDEVMDEHGGPALVCGWLSQHKQFGVISVDDGLESVVMHATHDAMVHTRVTTDWAYAQLVTPHRYDEEPMVHYLHATAAYNQAKPLQNGPLLTGWCSWYHYYENITEDNLKANFQRLTKMKTAFPTNMAMVDDGYMTAWGDWDSLKPKKFTSMEVVAKDIASSRMKPGLWMAPFAADKHSKIAKNHPDWIIKNHRGYPANSSNCGKFFYGLDATNPEVREHVFSSVRRAVEEWGFNVLKIDFLYAACLEGNGKYDMSMTRAEAMHLALRTIREAAGPDVYLVGCGCPMATGIGYIDGMRVSADTGPTWYPEFPLPWWDNGTLPSVRGMLRNSLSRAPFGHRWWQNDPDCLLLGETTKLTNEEVASAASVIAMTCGMLLVSDDLTKVGPERMKILSRIFPMTGVSGVVLDLHTTKNKGMPSMIRLWCTDRFKRLETYRTSESFQKSMREEDFAAEATHFGQQSAFEPNKSLNVRERTRSCIPVAQGMGTWTVISLSNWSDEARYMKIPRLAIDSPSETGWGTHNESKVDEESGNAYGYHVFSAWSGRYKHLSLSGSLGEDPFPIQRRLLAHETEIFHIRKVIPTKPQYVGSDIHFSCGYEVLSFRASASTVAIRLKNEVRRSGQVYLFVPVVDTSCVKISMAGKATEWGVVCSVPDCKLSSPSHCCGRILRIMVVVKADGSDKDGEILVQY